MADLLPNRDTRRVSRDTTTPARELSRRPSSRERPIAVDNAATDALSRRPSTREKSTPRVGTLDTADGVSTGTNATEAEAQTVPSAPGRLACYDIQKAVGKGGYAVVYKAVRKEDSKVVAIKRVEIFEMSPKKRERCLQEVHLLQRLSHPNIIQMLDAFIDENQLIIIFEWAPGGDLKRHIKKAAEAGRGFDEPTIWNHFFQVVDALRYMHTNRIMHRDIKPANVLLGANGLLKLADLGLGRQFSEQTIEAFSKVGTPYYVSPEVVRGEGYDWKSDVWSLGCLLYELVMLRSPFEMEGANLYDVFQKITKCDYATLPAETCSPTLRSLVAKLLHADPAKRPDVDEVWAVAQAVVNTQASTREDVHSLSERLVAGLSVLAAQHSGASSSGRAAAPTQVVQHIHPLFFAEPLYRGGQQGEGPTLVYQGGAQAEELHKAQLGTVLVVLAWLLRLAGKEEAALKVETEVDPKTKPLKGAAPWIANLPRARAILKGAEAAKRAAQTLGISTEFASAAQLGTGHGRAVCSVLAEAVDNTMKQLAVTLPPHRRAPEPEDEGVEDVDDGDELLMGGQQSSGGQVDDDGPEPQDEQQGYFLTAEAYDRARAAVEASTSSHTMGIIRSEVDPTKWHQELERVAPKLKQIKLKGGGHDFNDLLQRYQNMGELNATLKKIAQPLLPALEGHKRQLTGVLDRLKARETAISQEHHLNLGVLRSHNTKLRKLQEQVRGREETMTSQNHKLSEVNNLLQGVQSKIEVKTGNLDGGKVIAQLSEALVKLRREVKDMDIQAAVMWSQLTRRQTQHMEQQLEALANARGGTSHSW